MADFIRVFKSFLESLGVFFSFAFSSVLSLRTFLLEVDVAPVKAAMKSRR